MRTTITTWADAFGNWHARVDERGIGHHVTAEQLARTAIVQELTMREGRAFDAGAMTVRLVARVSKGKTLTSEYVEAWPADEVQS